MELIDRKTAIDLGLQRYFTGKPCVKGHIAERKVGNGCCTECSKILTKEWRENKGRDQKQYNPKGKQLPSVDYLKECFSYDNNTGQLIWKERPAHHFSSICRLKAVNSRFAGKVAGHYHSRNGYLEIRIDDKLYKGHRIIYKLVKEEEPEGMLDHIDGDVTNNRVENLRVATAQENARNGNKRTKQGTSGYKGVSLQNGRWCSCITIDDKVQILKFDTELEAAMDYDKRAKETFGEYAKLNFREGAHEE